MNPLGFEPGRPPAIAAHRGMSGQSLENSPEAFGRALDAGTWMIACDVRLSADGVPMVLRDRKTGRVAVRDVTVAATPSARLRMIPLKNGESIPLLVELLGRVGGRVPLAVEVHDVGGMAAVLAEADRVRYPGALLMLSALREECLAARALKPYLSCGLATVRPSMSDIAFCARHGLASIHPDHRALTPLRIRRVHEAKVMLVPWGVDDAGRFLALAEAGVAGVFSRYPEELRAAWNRRPGRPR